MSTTSAADSLVPIASARLQVPTGKNRRKCYCSAVFPGRLLTTSLLAGSLLLSVGCSEPSQHQDESTQPALDDALAAELIAELEDQFDVLGTAGLQVAVQVPGHSLWSVSVGVADLSTGAELLPDHRLKAASISKTFTAAVMLQLVGEGLVGLDDTLDSWDIEVFRQDEITIRHLLNHSSGLVEYTSLPSFAIDPTGFWSRQDQLALLAEEPLLFDPGTDWQYANSNYLALGLVIEAATQSTWSAEVTRRVLEPLSLSDTFAVAPEDSLPERVPGHVNDTVVQSNQELHHSATWAAGGVLSTASDLALWGTALYGSAFLAPAQQESMLDNPVILSSSLSYGLGVMLLDDDFGVQLGHNGALAGYAGWMGHRVDSGTTVVVLGNGWIEQDGEYKYDYPLDLAQGLWSVLLPDS